MDDCSKGILVKRWSLFCASRRVNKRSASTVTRLTSDRPKNWRTRLHLIGLDGDCYYCCCYLCCCCCYYCCYRYRCYSSVNGVVHDGTKHFYMRTMQRHLIDEDDCDSHRPHSSTTTTTTTIADDRPTTLVARRMFGTGLEQVPPWRSPDETRTLLLLLLLLLLLSLSLLSSTIAASSLLLVVCDWTWWSWWWWW